MVRLAVETLIHAPISLCFDLARDMNCHAESMAKSKERIVSCPPGGLLVLGDEVTFEAVHLGIKQRLTSRIVEYDRPNRFTDQMVKGAFKSLRHEHRFKIEGESTRMTDVVELEAPLGVLGRLAEAKFLGGYMRRVIAERGASLKAIAEAKAAQQESEL